MDVNEAILALVRERAGGDQVLRQMLSGMALALGLGLASDASGQIVQTHNPFLLAAQGDGPVAWGRKVATFASFEDGVKAFFDTYGAVDVYGGDDPYEVSKKLLGAGVLTSLGEDADGFLTRYLATVAMLGAAFVAQQDAVGAPASPRISASETLRGPFEEVGMSDSLKALLADPKALATWRSLAMAGVYGVLHDVRTGELRFTGNYTMTPCTPELEGDPSQCFLGYLAPNVDPDVVKRMFDDQIVVAAKTLGIEDKIASGDPSAWIKLAATVSGKSEDEVASMMTVAGAALAAMGAGEVPALSGPKNVALVLFENGDLLSSYGWLKGDHDAATRDLFGLLYYAGIQSYFGQADVGAFNLGRVTKDGQPVSYPDQKAGLVGMLEDLKTRADVSAALHKGDMDAMIVAIARSSPDAGTFDQKLGTVLGLARTSYKAVEEATGGEKTGWSAPDEARVRKLANEPPGGGNQATRYDAPRGRPWWHYGVGGLVLAGVGYGAYKLWQKGQR